MVRGQRARVAPRAEETRRSGFKSLRPHCFFHEKRFDIAASEQYTHNGYGMPSHALRPPMATRKCPVCQTSVKIENLERHVREQHPRAQVNLEALLTVEEREAARRTRAATRPTITRKGAGIITGIAIALAVALLLAILNPFGNVGPGIGQLAPDFTVRTTSGTTITLASYRGFPVLLEFMDVDCPACDAEAPTLVALYANYSGSVRFLSIDVNFIGSEDTDAKIANWAAGHGATWPYALDSTARIARSYGVTATPTTYLVDSSGVVRAIIKPPNNDYADFVGALAATGA